MGREKMGCPLTHGKCVAYIVDGVLGLSRGTNRKYIFRVRSWFR